MCELVVYSVSLFSFFDCLFVLLNVCLFFLFWVIVLLYVGSGGIVWVYESVREMRVRLIEEGIFVCVVV